MISNIKINGKIFEYHDIQCQYSIGSRANIYLKFNIIDYKDYKYYFLNMYDNKERFSIIHTKFVSLSNIIKSIDIDSNYIQLDIRSESIEIVPQDKRRDSIIEEIFNPTFSEPNNIQ